MQWQSSGDFRLQTVDDSIEVSDVATTIAVVPTLVNSADTDDLDDFAGPYQIDGHKKAISGASTAHHGFGMRSGLGNTPNR